MNTTSHRITSVIKDNNGEITSYKLDNNTVVDKQTAVNMAKNGEISGVTISKSKYDEEYLKGIPDGNKNNNLENLPTMNEEE